MSSDLSAYKVQSSPFDKEIEVPSSKSYANRLLVLAALSKEDIVVENLPLSSDVVTMLDCLEKIGLKIEREGSRVLIKGSFPECELDEVSPLYTGDGGTTNRFLIPLLARGRKEYEVIPEGHMRERPMEPLVDGLKDLGCSVIYNDENSWIKVKGPFQEMTSTEIDCSNSTQFLTGLALATVDLNLEVKAKNLEVSLPYWKLTQQLLKSFEEGSLSFHNPVDFSSLTYPLALAAVTGKVRVRNALRKDPLQADSLFIDALIKMGADIKFDENGLVCTHDKLSAIDFDGSQCPDAIPTLLYVCSFAEGVSKIFNLEVLTHKECNRFTEMIRILKAFGVKVEVDHHKYEILIHGNTAKKAKVELTPEKDHRMVMVSYLFMRTLDGGELYNSEHVAKSFGNFFEVMGG